MKIVGKLKKSEVNNKMGGETFFYLMTNKIKHALKNKKKK